MQINTDHCADSLMDVIETMQIDKWVELIDFNYAHQQRKLNVWRSIIEESIFEKIRRSDGFSFFVFFTILISTVSIIMN